MLSPELYHATFLSSNTQDFIEVWGVTRGAVSQRLKFLSSNTQDFIEVSEVASCRVRALLHS